MIICLAALITQNKKTNAGEILTKFEGGAKTLFQRRLYHCRLPSQACNLLFRRRFVGK